MPKKIRIEGVVHTFPDDFTDAEIAQALSSESAPKFQSWADKLSGGKPTDPFSRLPLDLAEGIVSGAAKTIYHGGDWLRRAMGSPRIINEPDVQQAMTAPPTPIGQTGQMLEQGAEFFIPAGVVGKGARAFDALSAGTRLGKPASIAARTLLEMGSAGGMAGLQTGGDPQAMTQAAGVAGAVTGGLGAIGAITPFDAIARRLKESGLEQYQRVLHPTKEGTKFLARTQAPQGLIERGVMGATLKTLQGKAAAQLQKWGQAIGDAWANIPPGTVIDLKTLTQGLDDTAKQFTVATPRGPVAMGDFAEQALANNQKLKLMLADIAEVNPSTKALEVPVERLRLVKQYFDDMAAKAGRYQGKTLAEHGMVEAQGRVADIAREEFAKQFPDIARINKEYNFWKNAYQVLDETVLRRTGQAKPLGRKAAGAVGMAAGFLTGGVPGAIAGKTIMDTLERVTTSPAWGTVSAVTKDRLANALAKGNRGEVEFWLRKILNATGGIRATADRPEPASQPAR